MSLLHAEAPMESIGYEVVTDRGDYRPEKTGLK